MQRPRNKRAFVHIYSFHKQIDIYIERTELNKPLGVFPPTPTTKYDDIAQLLFSSRFFGWDHLRHRRQTKRLISLLPSIPPPCFYLFLWKEPTLTHSFLFFRRTVFIYIGVTVLFTTQRFFCFSSCSMPSLHSETIRAEASLLCCPSLLCSFFVFQYHPFPPQAIKRSE